MERTQLALDWLASGRRVVAATLVETVGSAPLGAGAQMLVDDEGRIEGSVTGGCVEAALVRQAGEVLAGGAARTVSYGIADSEAADVGLTCGGTVRIFVHELTGEHREALSTVADAVSRGEPAALATALDGERAGAMLAVLGDHATGALGGPDLLERSVSRDARGMLASGRSELRGYGGDGRSLGSERGVFVAVFATPPAMVLVGAVDFSAALAQLASAVGYRVTICEPRAAFASSPRFAAPAEVVVEWPDDHLAARKLGPNDAVVVLSHDPKFDQPALIAALAGGAGYVGALGSRRTHADRLERLRAAGAEQDDLDRIASPCGLDIGAWTPAETAVSVLAEIIATRSRRDGGPLSRSEGPIHPRPAHRVAVP